MVDHTIGLNKGLPPGTAPAHTVKYENGRSHNTVRLDKGSPPETELTQCLDRNSAYTVKYKWWIMQNKVIAGSAPAHVAKYELVDQNSR
jgi:hypothetical protein